MTMATAQIIHCIACKEPVRPRQQGLQCDGCFRWNHRVCNTGISLEVYRAAVREGAEIEWRCEFCQHPDADSTMDLDFSWWLRWCCRVVKLFVILINKNWENLRFKNEHKTQEILNSERRELSTRNCLGIFSKEIREIDEFQLKSF